MSDFYVVFTQGEPPILDDSAPETDPDVRSVPVELDPRAAKAVAALLALSSFEVAHVLGAIYAAGVNQRQREAAGRSAETPQEPPPSPAGSSTGAPRR